jgi:hypothetical protein
MAQPHIINAIIAINENLDYYLTYRDRLSEKEKAFILYNVLKCTNDVLKEYRSENVVESHKNLDNSVSNLKKKSLKFRAYFSLMKFDFFRNRFISRIRESQLYYD